MESAGQFRHRRVAEAYGAVLAAGSAHGAYPGLGGVYQRDLMEQYVGMGFRPILAGNDLPFMMSAAGEPSAFLRSLEPV